MKTVDIIKKNKWFLLGFLGLGLISILNNFESKKGPPPVRDSIDTLIPAGYILVPLELENLEQVSSLIGNSGVIDLYTGGPGTQRRRIASRVKVIQAPYNPNVFAALVREQEGLIIQNYLGAFRAVVQNPEGQSGGVSPIQTKKTLSIIYQK